MAESYKILGQALAGELADDNLTPIESIVYEVPQNTKVSVSSIDIVNIANTSKTYNLSVVPQADVALAVDDFEYQVPVGTTEKYTWISGSWDKYGYSTDNVTWTINTITGSGFEGLQNAGMSFVHDKWFAIKYDSNINGYLYYYSTDFTTWTQLTMPSTISNFGPWKLPNYVNGRFVTIPTNGDSGATQSTDGITWEPTEFTSSDSKSPIGYINGKYTFLKNASDTYYSSNFQTWTLNQIPTSISNIEVERIVDNGNFLWALADFDYTPGGILYTTDGINWLNTTMPSTAISSITQNAESISYRSMNSSAATTKPISYSDNGTIYVLTNSKLDTMNQSYNQDGYLQVPVLLPPLIVSSTDLMTWSTTEVPVVGTAGPYIPTVYTSEYYDDPLAPTVTSHSVTVEAKGLRKSSNGFVVDFEYIEFINTVDNNMIVKSKSISQRYSNGTWSNEATYTGEYNLNTGIWLGIGFPVIFPIKSTTIYNTVTQEIPLSLSKNYIAFNKTISAKDNDEFIGGITLSAGDQIRIKSADSSISINISGVEIQ